MYQAQERLLELVKDPDAGSTEYMEFVACHLTINEAAVTAAHGLHQLWQDPTLRAVLEPELVASWPDMKEVTIALMAGQGAPELYNKFMLGKTIALMAAATHILCLVFLACSPESRDDAVEWIRQGLASKKTGEWFKQQMGGRKGGDP